MSFPEVMLTLAIGIGVLVVGTMLYLIRGMASALVQESE